MGTIRIARFAGIDIRVHYSWFAVVGLLTWWLAEGFYDEVYDDWSRAEAWTAAVISTLLFFTSVLLHELSHSLMAKRYGLPVASITLFIFGGVSSLTEEPSTARQEFVVAIVGPATSFVIGAILGVVTLVGYLNDWEGTIPIAICEYLAFINVAVGIFNMLPGFPLDGGRVLRSALWARSGNMLRATRWASTSGTFIAFGLMAAGVVSILLGSFIGGVWFIVIGWFLRNASDQSYQQLLLRRTLEGTKVGEVVNRSYHGAPPDIMLNDLVSQYMFSFSQRCVPIVVAGDLLGLIAMSDLRRFPPETWLTTSAFKAMTPADKLVAVEPQDDLSHALELMAVNDFHQLPVLEHREFLGFVTRADVVRLIQIRSELRGAPRDMRPTAPPQETPAA